MLFIEVFGLAIGVISIIYAKLIKKPRGVMPRVLRLTVLVLGCTLILISIFSICNLPISLFGGVLLTCIGVVFIGVTFVPERYLKELQKGEYEAYGFYHHNILRRLLTLIIGCMTMLGGVSTIIEVLNKTGFND